MPIDSLFLNELTIPFAQAIPFHSLLGATGANAWLLSLWSIVQVGIALGFVIFVHELGHFLAAKYFGVKCEKFYIGFDVPIKIGPIQFPSNLGKFQWGETEYGIGIIPLGGYVKMLGQDDDPRRAEEEAARIRQVKEGASESDPPKIQLDPRSFPAKPVYARMIIISAGVVMNLLFAVIMGAYAFHIGVPYQPSIVGSLIPGDPAWQSGIQVGDQFLQVGGMRKPNRQLHFRDMMEEVAIAGLSDETKPIPLVIDRHGQEQTLGVVPTKQHDVKRIRAMLGVRPIQSTKLSKPIIAPFHRQDIKDDEPYGLHESDVIVAVDGHSLALDERLGVATDYEARKYINAKNDKPVTLTLERSTSEKGKTERVDVVVPPLTMRSIGLQFAIEGVSAIQVDGPAAKAKVAVGDQLVEFNGKPIVDGGNFYAEVLNHCGKEVSLKLRKPDNASTETYELRWQVPELPMLGDSDQPPGAVGYELVGSGLTYSLRRTVSWVEPGSEAEKAGFEVGDLITQIQLQKDERVDEKTSSQLLEKIPVDNVYNAIWLNEIIQSRPAGSKIHIFAERASKIHDAVLTVQANNQAFQPGRGLIFDAASLTQRSTSLGNSLELGLLETGKRMGSVGKFLSLLATLRVPRQAVGGPGMIFYQASSAASEGFSTLLMFLVLLSANLAIINFLPIPALDGGHMIFLVAEWARGKPLNEEMQGKLTMGGVLCLLALMVFVIFNDTINLSGIFGR